MAAADIDPSTWATQHGFKLINTPPDGDCFFHCVAHALPDLSVLHLRQQSVDFLRAHRLEPRFEEFLTTTTNAQSLEAMRAPGVWNNDTMDVLVVAAATHFHLRLYVHRVNSPTQILGDGPHVLHVLLHQGHYSILAIAPSTMNALDALRRKAQQVEQRLYEVELTTTTSKNQKTSPRSSKRRRIIITTNDDDDETDEYDDDEYDDNIWQVEEVLDHRKVRGRTEFKIKWFGFAKPTWEPAEHLHDPQLIRDYFQTYVSTLTKDDVIVVS